MRLQHTLNELDSAIEQWDSITNKPEGEQATPQNQAPKKAKSLLKELREQLMEFDSPQIPTDNNKEF